MFIPPLPEHAVQALPQINVVVQQPSTGMPEWIKILITAVVGAVFGIVSAPATEAVKGYFGRIGLRKQFLLDELIDNLERAEHTLSRILLHAQDTVTKPTPRTKPESGTASER